MQEAFRLGGWGMYPTTFFGLILIVTAILYAQNPARTNRAIVRHVSLLVLLSGVLGFVTGVIKSFIAVSEMSSGDVGKVVVVGVGESLTNVGLSLVLLILATIISTLGVVRTRSSSKTELVAPRA